ncbi:FMN-binding negative transcriptional regulator [Galbitalea sp. SE-J8]|uniref:FMN-binding negative transcriptional regulator n=1 Tax=Galbitalea sp. SE-J8 TaxID=3054952 RepID=UPI0033904CC4
MRHTPHFLLTDADEVKRLIRENPWATIVSHAASGLVASHYPFLLEESARPGEGALLGEGAPLGEGAGGITLVSHVGRPDEQLHELGQHEVLVIVQGAHGYVSPSAYDSGDFIPTWNHVTAHLYGVPEILSDEENFRVLGDLVDRFEERMPHPVGLDVDEATARRIAKGTVGIRLRVTRFDARAKLSQNKPAHVRERIIAALEGDGPYAQPWLAAEMRRLEGDGAAHPWARPSPAGGVRGSEGDGAAHPGARPSPAGGVRGLDDGNEEQR